MDNTHVDNIESKTAQLAINQISCTLDDVEYKAMVRGVITGYGLLFKSVNAHEVAQIFEDAYVYLCFDNPERAINKLKLLLP
ncbi:hypothetical protein [Colwellia sp. E150_009]